MYNVNRLERNVLITVEEVLFHAPTKHTIDPRIIEQSIIIAEERFLREELGYAMYDYMVTNKNVVVDAGNLAATQVLVGSNPILAEGNLVNSYEYLPVAYKTLWKQLLWKLTAECVIATAFPEGFVQFSSEGVFHTVPPAGLMVTSGLVTPLLTTTKWALDKKIKDRIGPMIQATHNYICRNKTDFAYYTKDCPSCNDQNKNGKWSGLALGLYDDEEESNKNCCS